MPHNVQPASDHEHNWTSVGGPMEVQCTLGHWHYFYDGPEFNMCWCGETRNQEPLQCPSYLVDYPKCVGNCEHHPWI